MVEWKEFGMVCKVHTGSQLNRADMLDNGLYPVVNGGREYSGYTDKHNEGANTITISQGGESAGFVNWIDENFWAGAHCYVVEETHIFNKRYLYHTLKNKEREIQLSKQGAGIPGLNRNTLYKLTIPIPSPTEQQRIVDILDTFTFSIENLKQQIAQRRKQYEYYRDQLLDIDGKEGVDLKTLVDFGDVTKLAGFEFTEHVKYQENGSIIALRGLNVRDGHLDLSQVKYIDGSNFSKLERSKLLVDDMLFTYVGTIGNVALIDENEKYYLAPNVSRIRFDRDVIIPKYALYIFLSDFFHRTQINKYLNSSSMKNLSMENIRKFSLPIPSLSIQQRIVSILDTFEASIANLEAQLAQREKQYEYYRNKLLTFE